MNRDRAISIRPGLVLLAVGCLLACGCREKAAAPAGPPVLAKVGTQTITADDLRSEAARRQAANQPVLEKSVLLQQMVDRLALVERAKLAGLDADLETRRTIEGVLITKLRERELESKLAKVEVSEEEIRKEYDAEAATFTKSAKVRLAILFQEMTPTMSEGKKAEVRQRMEEGLGKVVAEPASGGRGPAAGGFGAVAVEYSEDQVSRYRGGDIGWLDQGNFSYRWPRPVLEAGYALEKGKMSGIIEAPNGLYVVMKTDARDSAVTSFDEARPGLRQGLLSKKRRALEAAFLQETAQLVKPELNASALAGVELPAATPRAAPPAEPLPPGNPVSISNSKPN